jgi:hypothetical protein
MHSMNDEATEVAGEIALGVRDTGVIEAGDGAEEGVPPWGGGRL